MLSGIKGTSSPVHNTVVLEWKTNSQSFYSPNNSPHTTNATTTTHSQPNVFTVAIKEELIRLVKKPFASNQAFIRCIGLRPPMTYFALHWQNVHQKSFSSKVAAVRIEVRYILTGGKTC